ncbi:acetylcholine receptor subunit beta-like [Mya arenaria]|uniref:acetylcholine receptor subunit beta-like n=1 Tax=Mya arenaria TaxID=6604 RepID=UPI0022E53953|nr:acetylcholine receptor subunit beta-like [Mya arenaria]
MRPALIFILPLFLLVMLSPLVFLLPADTNDRVGLAVTVLLATSVYMTLVADKLPDSSDPIPIIIIVFFLWFIYNGLIVALVLLNLQVFYKDKTKPVPGCLRRFVSFINHVCCAKPNQDNSSESEITDKMPNDCGDSEPDTHYEGKVSNVTWRDVSKALDKILLVTMYGIKIGFDVTIFLILYTGDDDKTGEEQIYDKHIIEYIYGNRDSMRPYRY